MKQKVPPAAIAGVVVVVLALLGFFGIKAINASSENKPYVAGVKPPDLEKHVNAPPGISSAGGGGGESQPASGGAGGTGQGTAGAGN